MQKIFDLDTGSVDAEHSEKNLLIFYNFVTKQSVMTKFDDNVLNEHLEKIVTKNKNYGDKTNYIEHYIDIMIKPIYLDRLVEFKNRQKQYKNRIIKIPVPKITLKCMTNFINILI